MQIYEILVNPERDTIALLAPNGHPVDPTPWLLISPNLCDGGEGTDWVGDEHVRGWYRVEAGLDSEEA
jgi:hypothetical protein